MKLHFRSLPISSGWLIACALFAGGCPNRESGVPGAETEAPSTQDEASTLEERATPGIIKAPVLLTGRREGPSGVEASGNADGAQAITPPPVSPSVGFYMDPVVEMVVADGFQLMAKGDMAGAIERFSEAIRREPTASRPWFAMGTVLFIAGQNREAVKAMRQSVDLRPDDHLPVNNLAWILATSDDAAIRDPIEAVNLARRAILMAPADYHTWSTLAESYYAKGEFHNALKPAQQAMDMVVRLGGTDDQVKEQEIQLRRIQEAARVMDIIE